LAKDEVAIITGHKDADALYAFKSRGFDGEVGLAWVRYTLLLERGM